MTDGLRRRLNFIGLILGILTVLIAWRLVSLQFYVDTGYFAQQANLEYHKQVSITPPRGELYDRNGVLLATNAIEYEIGLSPRLILDRESTAEKLSEATGLSKDELMEAMADPDVLYVLLVRPAPAAMGQRVLALKLDGIVVTPLTRRYYPHGTLASQVLGFVRFDSNEGFYGIEGYYNDVLAGEVGTEDQSRIPFDATRGEGWRNGSDLYLTLDSEIQYLAESTLDEALKSTGAQTGTIIVMNPRTGEIMAMASRPTYDPNRYFDADPVLWNDPAISAQYEPGSTAKAMTMAIALEDHTVNPDSTYEDRGVLDIGGIEVYNWDRAAHGVTSMTQLLAKSLNVGAATLAIGLGPTRYYDGVQGFGIGQPTGIDLAGEIGGTLARPGQTGWTDASLASNAFGQGMATTPLQMITAVAAIANDGLLVQPHMVTRRVDADQSVTNFGPTVIGRAISVDTAHTLSDMLANALQSESSGALVPGYRIAGKTGTAQIPGPGGYEENTTIASFIGYGPVDDPRFIVLIKLDRPTSSPWGSETAAPAFSQFVKRLVVLLEIPPDTIRQAAQAGG